MNRYEVISDVGKTLVQLIFDNSDDLREDPDSKIKDFVRSQENIILSSPKNSKGKLSLFLYQIMENIHLKNQESFIEDSKIKSPPLFLSLFYLITANTDDDHLNHIIMSKVLQILHDNIIIRGSVLQNSLKGEELRLYLNHLSIDDLNKIWTIISGSDPYKFSISLEVTPVKIYSMHEMEIVRVKERDLDYYDKEANNK